MVLDFRRLAAGVICAFGLAGPARAVDDDFQTWQQFIVSTKFQDGVSGVLEVQPRFTDESSRLGQLLIRPSLSLTLFDQTVLSLGYAYVRTSPAEGEVTHEHRPWQQLAFPIASRDGVFSLSGRTRFEQRFREDGDDVGLRLRQQVRLTVPLAQGWQGVAWSEGFFNFNDTDWGARSGLDRWRNFAGVRIPLRDGVSLEPGYLNQFVNRRTTDLVDHVLSATLNVSF
jgi:hypothetical protein